MTNWEILQSAAQEILLKASVGASEQDDTVPISHIDVEIKDDENESVSRAPSPDPDDISSQVSLATSQIGDDKQIDRKSTSDVPLKQPHSQKMRKKLANTALIWPLDEAINQSVHTATDGMVTGERARNFYQNILLIGGGSLINGFSALLEERYLSLIFVTF